MNITSTARWTVAVMAIAFFAGVASMSAQAASQTLGSVHIARKVLADGKPLPVGTYVVQLSSDAVTPVVGQTAGAEKWVEFVQAGAVKGRELATVVSGADAKQVAKVKLPAAGTAKVEMLKGADYLRVWINHAGTQYLVHLSVAPK